MAGLADTQRLFQDRLLNGSDELRPQLTDGGQFLKVYDHAYEARLVEVMEEDYPAVHTLLGDDAFAEAAAGYVRAYPSKARSIRWLGASFAPWLRDTDPWRELLVAADMAAFEWALGLAFDAPDAVPLGIDELGKVPPEAWPALTFDAHPSLHTFELGFDVAPFQRAVAEERDPDAAPAGFETTETWAAWRAPDTLRVRYRALAPDEAIGLASLQRGESFAALCEVLAEHGEPDSAAARAAGFLGNWIGAGWLIGLMAEGLSWS